MIALASTPMMKAGANQRKNNCSAKEVDRHLRGRRQAQRAMEKEGGEELGNMAEEIERRLRRGASPIASALT